MKKEKVYIETTIPSYLVSEKSYDIIVCSRQLLTERWWNEYSSKYDLSISDVVIEEISKGNAEYAQKRLEIISKITVLPFVEEIENITAKYQKHFKLPETLLRDMYHIAFSVYYEIDYLLTWNCNHLANAHFKKQLEKFNNKFCYKTPELITPDLLMN